MNQWVGVLGAEETLELGGVTPEHLRNFFGIEAGEASGLSLIHISEPTRP